MLCMHEIMLVEKLESKLSTNRFANNDTPEMDDYEADDNVLEVNSPISYVSTLPRTFFHVFQTIWVFATLLFP